MILVCPKCKAGKIVPNRIHGIICSNGCGYFTQDTTLSEDEAISVNGGRVKLIDKVFTEIKADWEKKAYEWKDQQLEKRKRGEVRSHEPRE